MFSRILGITVVVFLFRRTSSVSGNSCSRSTTFVANQNGQEPEEAQVLLTIRANSVTRCSLFCLHHAPDCQSFRYNHDSKLCELLENIKPSEVNVNSRVVYTLKPSADCDEMLRTSSKNIKNGIYLLGSVEKKKQFMHCNMETDEGGWTVFQRRRDNSVNFDREWLDYKNGFGNICGEFWLGNDLINEMTSSGEFKLRLDVQLTTGETYFAIYEGFCIATESDNYRMSPVGSNVDGNGGNFLTKGPGNMFTTSDRDMDTKTDGNCADGAGGGWWYEWCYSCSLNGYYDTKFKCNVINSDSKNLTRSEMKFKRN